MFVLTYDAGECRLPVRVIHEEDIALVLAHSTVLKHRGRYALHPLGEGVRFDARGPLPRAEAEQLAARVRANEAA
jgi:hypothetical protein